MVYILMAEGFEEIEAISPCDILLRANIEVKLVSVTGKLIVRGGHGIEIKCDCLADEIRKEDISLLVLPGGGLGVENLDKYKGLDSLLEYLFNNNIWVAAICAAPSLLGKRGWLKGKKAVCYPGFEKYLIGASISEDACVVCDNVITAKAAGTAMEFGFCLAEKLKDAETSKKIREAMYYV